MINNIKSFVRIQNGLITEHTDYFNLYKWSKQALGITGVLFGWSSFLQNKIKKQAREGLQKFMNEQLT